MMSEKVIHDEDSCDVHGQNYRIYQRFVEDPLRPIACAPVERNSSEYNMNHRRRGKCLVFYYTSFSPSQNLMRRESAEGEKDLIATSFASLGFEVEAYHNLNKVRLLEVMDAGLFSLSLSIVSKKNGKNFGIVKPSINVIVKSGAACFAATVASNLVFHLPCAKMARREDHCDCDCLAVVFISHGRFDEKTKRRRLYTFDDEISSEDLWKFFTGSSCLTLAGKPKLFFVQATGGRQARREIIERPWLQKLALSVDTDSNAETYVLPSHADILIMWATFPGDSLFTSKFGGVKGCLFALTLSKVLQEKGYEHSLSSILFEVTKIVASEYGACVQNDSQAVARKEVPKTESTLLRHLYFKQKTT